MHSDMSVTDGDASVSPTNQICNTCDAETADSLTCGCSLVCCATCFKTWVECQRSTLCMCGKKYVTYLKLHKFPDILAIVNTLIFWKKSNHFKGRPYAFTVVCCGNIVEKNGTCAVCSKMTCSQCLRHSMPNAANSFDNGNLCNNPHRCGCKVYASLRNCPQCLAYMEKRDGCDEMFCSSCFTSFNYSTGAILNKIAQDSLKLSHFNKQGLVNAFKYSPAFSYTIVPLINALVFEMYHYVSLPTSTFNEWSYYMDLMRLMEETLMTELKLVKEASLLLNAIPARTLKVFAHLDTLSKVLFQDTSAQCSTVIAFNNFCRRYREELVELYGPLKLYNQIFLGELTEEHIRPTVNQQEAYTFMSKYLESQAAPAGRGIFSFGPGQRN